MRRLLETRFPAVGEWKKRVWSVNTNIHRNAINEKRVCGGRLLVENAHCGLNIDLRENPRVGNRVFQHKSKISYNA